MIMPLAVCPPTNRPPTSEPEAKPEVDSSIARPPPERSSSLHCGACRAPVPATGRRGGGGGLGGGGVGLSGAASSAAS